MSSQTNERHFEAYVDQPLQSNGWGSLAVSAYDQEGAVSPGDSALHPGHAGGALGVGGSAAQETLEDKRIGEMRKEFALKGARRMGEVLVMREEWTPAAKKGPTVSQR